MRLKPSVGLAIALFALYTVVVIGTAALLQPDAASFEDAFDDLDNSRYLVYMLIAGVVLGAVVATVGGWWSDIFADDRQVVGPVRGWHRFVPIVVLVLVLATTDYPALADIDGELLAWIVAASVLVGISEELMFRGNVVVCLRRTPVSEHRVWIISSVLFALIHLGNVALDAPVSAAISNTILAFLGGTMFYVVRRASGSILASMALHGLWDFTLFTADEAGYGAARTAVYIVLVVALIVTRRNLFDEPSNEPNPVPAA